MTQLIAAGRVSYAYVGIETEDLIPSIAKRLGYPVSHGAVVTAVHPGTPGAAAGLRAGADKQAILGSQFTSGGDVIVSIGGHPVGSAEDVVRVVTEQLSPGESVAIVFIRHGARHRATLKLAQRPANPG
jgi:S1-C subfamily serine protease